ncbi:MAG TPA: GNAT family N-acetyltransferase [Bryobacteraceae bacterium]|nr:GNAT family N-acetyltransferase [Bryobacteraceae bacterium]
MPFSDLALARRLERAEGHACRQFAEARKKLFPDCGSEWMEAGGACVVFDGVDSPVTQTFGLGVFEELRPETLAAIEKFFFEKGAAAHHEVSPLAGVAALDLLCARGYRPIEISSVLYQPMTQPNSTIPANITVRVAGPEDAANWSDVSARGWAHQNPELMEFMRKFGAVAFAKTDGFCFLGAWDGQPAAAGALNIHNGVALFTGAATVPEMRRRGLQGALLAARMQYAFERGCDLAMMVAEAGSESQRNAERKGFRIAYTRMKWRLSS